MTSCATLVLANHRPESVPAATALMARHDAVILEEPPDPGFGPMLTGRLGIDDYLATLDLEYPEFGRRMSEALRRLHEKNCRLYQVEPFLERLLEIHERFADGGRPQDLVPGSDRHAVYTAEKEATAALIQFYRVSVQGGFDETLASVKQFARCDARRFMLRDRMRADAIVRILAGRGAYYIEAGHIHYPLWQELKRRLPAAYPLKVNFLMRRAVREMGCRGHLYGPGDLLTLLYRFHPGVRRRREDLLAGRALIYSKLVAKEEIVNTAGAYPHTRDELETAAAVRALSLEDCRRLFPSIRRASTETARDRVRHYQRLTSGKFISSIKRS